MRPSATVEEGAQDAQPEIENVNTKTPEVTNSPSTSASMQMDTTPSTPPTRETSVHTSPPGSSQWETAFDSSPPFNSPPAFTAWEGPPTRSVTPSDDGPSHRISPIAEENAETEQLEQASDKTETASATSDTVANEPVASDNLAVPGAMPVDDPAPATAKPKLYSEEGGPVVQPEEHAALREVALGVEAPAAVVERDDGGQTVVLDRLMSSIASPMPSPFRKSFTGLATNPFLKRSLGGMLRPSRSRRGSDAVPPTPTRLTQSTTADEPPKDGGGETQAADTAPADGTVETAPEPSTQQSDAAIKAAPSTPPAQDSNVGSVVSPKSLPVSPSAQIAAQTSPQRQTSASSSPRQSGARSPPLQLASPPPPRQFRGPSSSPQSRNPSPTRQFASPSPTRQFVIPSPPRPTHINQMSIDRAMASDTLAEAVAAMSLAEAQAQAQAPAPRPVTVIRSPQPPSATTHWAFGPRRASAQSNPDDKAVPTTPTSAPGDGALSWRTRVNAVSPPLNRDLQQLINPDGAMLKPSERIRQDEGDQDEPVIAADEELKGDADATIQAERPPTGAAAPRGSQRGSQVTNDGTNEAAAASQPASPERPSSPNASTTPINSPPAALASSLSRPSPFKSSPVRTFPTVPAENQNVQPGGLSPPKRLQATSATFVPRTMLSTTPETQPLVPEPHPFSFGHSARVSDASSTFTFGPPSVQPSPIKPHKQLSSMSGRFRPGALPFQPVNADPMPQDAAATSNVMGNGALGLFTFPQKLRPNAIEFKPSGLAAKTRFSPGSGSGPGQGFRPPALDLSAAGPSSRAFAAFPVATSTLGKPFEFNSSKPSLVVIRKPNPIPILKPKDAEGPTATTKLESSPVRQSASPRNDAAVKAEQPLPSDVSFHFGINSHQAGAEDPASASPRDSPRRRQHTAKRSSQNSHLPRVFSERSQPSTPVDGVRDDVQIHQSKPIRLENAVGHMVRASSDGVVQAASVDTPAPSHKTSESADAAAPATEGSKMNRTVSAPTVLSAKAKPFVLGGQYSQSVSESAKRLDDFLHHNPHISNHNSEVADENKFRHWVFPRPETHSRSPSAEDSRPLSHKRRHEDTEEDAQADEESGGDDGSVDQGETTSKWPNWSHAAEVLSPESNAFTTTDTSAEFPMRRTPPRRLSVINTTTPPRAPSPTPGGISTPLILPRAMLVEMLTTMKGVGEQVVQSRNDHQRLLDESTKRAEAAAKQSAMATETLEKIKGELSEAGSQLT